jgi:hypothetical protein
MSALFADLTFFVWQNLEDCAELEEKCAKYGGLVV